MTLFHKLLVIPILSSLLPAATPGLDQAEIKMPYGELKKMLADAAAAAEPQKVDAPVSALLSSRLRFSLQAGKTVLDGTFRTTNLGPGLALVPLLGGNLTIESRQPGDSNIWSVMPPQISASTHCRWSPPRTEASPHPPAEEPLRGRAPGSPRVLTARRYSTLIPSLQTPTRAQPHPMNFSICPPRWPLSAAPQLPGSSWVPL